jgi:chromosome segregation ATPase
MIVHPVASAGWTADGDVVRRPGIPAVTVPNNPIARPGAHLAYRAPDFYTLKSQASRKQAITIRQHNKVILLGTFEQYLRKAAASLNPGFRRQAEPLPRFQELERELLALTRENQTLAGKLERFRADTERLRSAELRKFETLEQAHRETATARATDARRLSELEQRLVEVQAERTLEHDRIKALEDFLAETKSRLETRDNQLKFLQDSAREQLHSLKTSQAEASSRLETRDNELANRQDAAHEQILALETSLAEASRRFEITDSGINALREQLVKQTQQHEASRASANTWFEATANQIRTLEKKLEVEHTLQQNLFQETEAQTRKQEERLNRAMAAAGFIVVLAAVAGAIIYWLVR